MKDLFGSKRLNAVIAGSTSVDKLALQDSLVKLLKFRIPSASINGKFMIAFIDALSNVRELVESNNLKATRIIA